MARQVTIDIRDIAQELHLAVWQVQAVIELLEAGNTIPFITRYRRDVTGGLDEEQIRRIQSRLISLRLLAERKQTILRSIENQGRLTPELEKAILEAKSPSRLEDVYLPYKPKKQTLATLARSRGLQKLADEILQADPSCHDLDKRAADFVDPDKKVHHVADALAGAGHIIAECFSERADLREKLRQMLREVAFLVASPAEPPKSLKLFEKVPEAAAPCVPKPSEQVGSLLAGGEAVSPEPAGSHATERVETTELPTELAASEVQGIEGGVAKESHLEMEINPPDHLDITPPGTLGHGIASPLAETTETKPAAPEMASQTPVPRSLEESWCERVARVELAAGGHSEGTLYQKEAGDQASHAIAEVGVLPSTEGAASSKDSPAENSSSCFSGEPNRHPDEEGENGGCEDSGGNGNGGHLSDENASAPSDNFPPAVGEGNGSGSASASGGDFPKEVAHPIVSPEAVPINRPEEAGSVPFSTGPGGEDLQRELLKEDLLEERSASGSYPASANGSDFPQNGGGEANASGQSGVVTGEHGGSFHASFAVSEAGEPNPQIQSQGVDARSGGEPPASATGMSTSVAPPAEVPAVSTTNPSSQQEADKQAPETVAETAPDLCIAGGEAVPQSVLPETGEIRNRAQSDETVGREVVSGSAVGEAPLERESAGDSVSEAPKPKRKKKRKKRKKAAEQPDASGTESDAPTAPAKLSRAAERWLQRRAAFADYFKFRQKVDGVAPHQILALNRGERLGVLRVKLEYDLEPLIAEAERLCIRAEHPHADFLKGCLRDALVRLVMPALEREIRRELTDKAEEHALRVFARNLRTLLLQPPVRNRRVLAIDPGLRNGCTAVALDEFGNVLGYGQFFVIGAPEELEKGKQLLCQLIERYRIDLIAVGNGTGSRRTEPFVANLLSSELKDRNIHYCIVNEAGASLYSTSPLAREELPDYSPALRSAISIGRRLQDPLSELVKIEPSHLGVGLYQHDIQAAHLRASLAEVVESCVNYVGVDVNMASVALLRYVSGLNQLTARRIYEYRRQNGPFRNRLQLRDVPGIGEATFVQAAGFLKIPDGDNPLDATWIHPESYPVAEKVLQVLGFTVQDLRSREQVQKLRAAIETVNPKELCRQLGVGELTLRDILAQLARPGRDPREDFPGPIFRQGILRLQDLKPGMALQGTVSNVVDFGVFVDFGLPITGLVHISEMSTKYVRDPHEVAEIGDMVHVWVREVDLKRRRVSLTMIPPGTPRERRPRGPSEAEVQAPGRARKPKGKEVSGSRRPHPPAAKQIAPEGGDVNAPREGARASMPADRPPAKATTGPGPSSSPLAEPASSRGLHSRRKRSQPPPIELPEEVLSGKRPMSSFAELAEFFRLKSRLEAEKQKESAEKRKEAKDVQSQPANELVASPPTSEVQASVAETQAPHPVGETMPEVSVSPPEVTPLEPARGPSEAAGGPPTGETTESSPADQSIPPSSGASHR